MAEKQTNTSFKSASSEGPAFRETLEQLSNTKEMRELAGNLIPELIRLWAVSGTGAGAARNTFRKSVASAAGNSIKNAMLDEKGLAEAPALHTLAKDAEFTRQASARAGELKDGLSAVLVNAANEIEGLDVSAKKVLLETVINDLSSGKSAELLTICCRTINDIHQDDTEFLSRVLAPVFENWLKNMDFGELKETFESGTPGIAALIHMINETMWNYPGKVISIVALIPSILNITLDALAQTAGSFNNKGTPDMVADVLLTVISEIDADALSGLINELAESARQLHVGSALIGEPGSPKLPNDLATLFDAVMKSSNGEVLWKARTALAELKGQAHCAMTDALSGHPDLLADSIATKSGVHNARIRAISHRLSALEAFVPEVINNALDEAAASLDVQEGANIINTLTLLATRMLEARPDEINDKATSLIDALDVYGLTELAEKTGEVVGDALKPLARSVVPHLARGVLSSLATDDDEFEDVAQEARHLLVALLKDGKVDHNG